MPITLAQAKLATLDDIQKGVIDEFIKSNFILDRLTFDDAVTPGGPGSTLTYGYTRVITEASAAFRAINAEYSPSEATVQRYSVDLKAFGGTFQIDRVLAKTGGLYDNVEFQLAQKIKATNALFNDTFINGDIGTNANAFDGLAKAITGTSTEYNAAAVIDLSTSSALDTNYKIFMDALDEFLSTLDGKPDCIAGNTKLINKIKSVARRSGYLTSSENAFGVKVDGYDNIPLIDLGAKPGSANPISQIVSRTVGTAQTGLTDLFAWRFGLDAVHGVSLAGQAPIQTFMPDFKAPGAVKTGEVEMVAALALKRTKAAGVFRNIKVQ